MYLAMSNIEQLNVRVYFCTIKIIRVVGCRNNSTYMDNPPPPKIYDYSTCPSKK